MKILLCAATEMEIAATIQFLSVKHNHNVDVLITGVGMVACTYALTKYISVHHPGLIIQAGIAGCLDKNFSLTQVVAVRNETVGDLGVEENNNFRSLFDLNFLNDDALPWKKRKLCNENEIIQQTGLTIVDGVTVNEISTNQERIHYYHHRLGAQIETMEGAALHFVALLEKIPFLQIRSLSNFIGERDKSKWMMEKSITSLNSALQHFLTKQFSL